MNGKLRKTEMSKWAIKIKDTWRSSAETGDTKNVHNYMLGILWLKITLQIYFQTKTAHER